MKACRDGEGRRVRRVCKGRVGSHSRTKRKVCQGGEVRQVRRACKGRVGLRSRAKQKAHRADVAL